MTNEEMNRFCAEALGWHPYADEYWCKCTDGRHLGQGAEWALEGCEDNYNNWPVFAPLHSESANAMLLEGMLWGGLNISFTQHDGGILCTVEGLYKYPWAVPDTKGRRTAIVLAFIAWIKSGGKVEH